MINLDELVAPLGVAPKAWQSAAPRDAYSSRPAVTSSDELRRIVNIARRPVPSREDVEAMVELMTLRLSNGRPAGKGCRCAELEPERPNPCITRLLPVQAWALFEIGIAGGLLGPIGVGHGKTLLGLLTPRVMRKCDHAVMLVPPNLVKQLMHEYNLYSQHFRLTSIIFEGKDFSEIVPNSPVLRIMPYSLLSRSEATVCLEEWVPDTIIADEVHKLKNRDTATTSRVMRYFEAHPATRFCGCSPCASGARCRATRAPSLSGPTRSTRTRRVSRRQTPAR
jgi:hypothetical protein